MKKKVIVYTRVSTQKQGLGLVAQREAIDKFLAEHDGEFEVIGDFTETYSGKSEHRPEFDKALALCKRSGAAIMVAKMDRLGRAKYLFNLLGKSDFQFIALDTYGRSDLENALRVAIAVEEVNKTSERTSGGLQAKKSYLAPAKEAYERGDIETAQRYIDASQVKSRVKRSLNWWVERNFNLGSVHTPSAEERDNAAKLRKHEADTDEANVAASEALRHYLAQGGKRTSPAMAKYLNENYYKTRRGGLWKPQSVVNLVKRFNL